jgi:hypothetical protein
VEVTDAFLVAEKEVMERVLVALRDTYGSAEGYLESHGLEPEAIAALRSALLEPAGD